MHKWTWIWVLTAGILLALGPPAEADVRVDSGSATFDMIQNRIAPGTPDWFAYPQPDGTIWWNTWFYNDPPDPDRWKWIEYDIFLTPSPSLISFAPLEVAINWTTMDYPEQGPGGSFPGLVADAAGQIVRQQVWLGTVPPSAVPITGRIVIPDYNPEWVSLDIRGLTSGTAGFGDVRIDYTIMHECVPLPGAVVLGGVGLAGAGIVQRRRRKRA